MSLESTDSLPAKSVGIWIRVSTENQALGDSPEHHERRARAYAESRGWTVEEVYRLEAVSGKAVRGHPETERMLTDIETGRIDALIFSKLARLARNTRELLDFADYFRDHGADLVSLQESIDTSTPAGRLFYTVIAAMAQWEREEIAERTAASVKVRASLGKPLGGRAPLGYQWKNRQLVPDPDEAPVVRELFDLFLKHRKKKTVARILNNTGHRTRSRKPFSAIAVSRLLTDPAMKGQRRTNYSTNRGGNKVVKPKDEWVTVKVEPIVPKDVWAQVDAILVEQGKGRQPARKAAHLFTGLAWCECGARMYVRPSTGKYTCKDCFNKIPVDDLEAVFYEKLQGFLLSPEEIAEHLDEAAGTIREKEKLLSTLSRKRKRVQAEIDKLFDLHSRDEIPTQGFGLRYRPLETQLKQLENEIPALQGEIDFLKISHLSSDEVISEARQLSLKLPDLEFEERRRIVTNIVDRIVVGKREVDIHLYHLPSASPRSLNDVRKGTQQGGWGLAPLAEEGQLGRRCEQECED